LFEVEYVLNYFVECVVSLGESELIFGMNYCLLHSGASGSLIDRGSLPTSGGQAVVLLDDGTGKTAVERVARRSGRVAAK